MKKSELFRKMLDATFETYISTHSEFAKEVIDSELNDAATDSSKPEVYDVIKAAAEFYIPYVMECVAAGVTNVLAETMCDDNDLDLTSYEAIRGISDEVWKEIES